MIYVVGYYEVLDKVMFRFSLVFQIEDRFREEIVIFLNFSEEGGYSNVIVFVVDNSMVMKYLSFDVKFIIIVVLFFIIIVVVVYYFFKVSVIMLLL